MAHPWNTCADLHARTHTDFKNSLKECPSFLCFDKHDSHLSNEVSDLRRENAVMIFTFPPHCTTSCSPWIFGYVRHLNLLECCHWQLDDSVFTMNAVNISNSWYSESCTPERIISRRYVWIMEIWNFPIWQISFHRWRFPWQLQHWSTLGGASHQCCNKLNNCVNY